MPADMPPKTMKTWEFLEMEGVLRKGLRAPLKGSGIDVVQS